MSKNFKLSYNDGAEYVGLYPRTEMKNIFVNGKLLKVTTVEVVVPPTEELRQTIPFKHTISQEDSNFFVKLLGTGVEAERAYLTIDQAEVNSSGLVLTRLSKKPTTEIRIALIFQESVEN